jgi:DNA-binding response OmpR family regulator
VSSVRPLILAVEPDERTRSLLEVGFAEQGFTLVAASSAEEAQGFLRPEWMLPSMIFCEADLRGLDGFTLCGQIRADARTTDLPVVLLSKTPDAFHREMAGGAGADQLLPKPLFLNDLVAMARLMAGRGSAGGRYEADTAELPLAQALRQPGVRRPVGEEDVGVGDLVAQDEAPVDQQREHGQHHRRPPGQPRRRGRQRAPGKWPQAPNRSRRGERRQRAQATAYS